MKHKTLTITCLLFLSINLLFAQKKKKTSVHHIDALSFEKAAKNINKDKNILLDVRTQKEYEQWHFEKATLVNYFAKGFKRKVRKLDHSKTVYVYCHSGIRSGLVVGILKKQGFPVVYNMKGGTAALEKAHKKAAKQQ